jgi:rare lipoprotein A (peptidoglycan hydrolase)
MSALTTADFGLGRRLFWPALGVLLVTVVTCRTPPPLPTAPSAASASAPEPKEAAAAGPKSAGVASKSSPSDDAAIAIAEPQDFSHEQAELAERYAKRKALSTLRGEASYYGRAFAGRKTASGETFEPARFTAAHRTLPFGSVLRVTRIGTKSVVYVRVNDRGPFGKKRRILDLSEAAAGELDMLRDGVCEVRIEVLERGKQ